MDVDGGPSRGGHPRSADQCGRSGRAPLGLRVRSYPDDDAHLLLFAVRSAQQRRGVGSAILHWLEEAARTAGAKRIRVECRRDNTAARNFYCEHAYDELSITTKFYRGLKDGIHLVKWLRPVEVE